MDNSTIPCIFAGMDADVIIAGGGLTGPILALALAQGGMRSLVLDAGHSRSDGRAYALSLASVRMLRALGLWSALEPMAQPMELIRVSDGRPGEGPASPGLAFDYSDIGPEPMGWMLEDAALAPVLEEAVSREALVSFRRGVQARHDGPGAVLADGERLRAPLVAGCDGRRSGIAASAGIARDRRDYRQASLVATIGHERDHLGVAHQLFLPAGPLAILPLKGRRVSIVWTETTERAAEISALDDAGFLAALRPVFGDFLGQLSLEGQRFAYPLDITVAQRMTAERLALVGDAAHGLHPLAGQGLNLGLRDVAALAEILSEARQRGEDIGGASVLAAYERWRRFDVTALAAATDNINRIFSNDIGPLRILRGLGLDLVERIGPLKQAFMREAAGITGDVPRLMRGEALYLQTGANSSL